jgi:ATP-binding cassette, subfamily B, bacterial
VPPHPARPVSSLWRLRGYLRPYRLQLTVMLAAATLSAAGEIVIPLLIKSVIDGAIAHHDKGLLVPLGIAAIALGAVTAVLNLVRRWIQGNAVADIEKTLRDDLYAHLQDLEPGFHDQWQSGQLLSRATTDLAAIRRFAGFGIVFLFTSIMTFIAVIVLLIQLNWWLGLATGCAFAPVLVFCTQFERKYKVLARRVQDQQGDLATIVEEAAVGIRVVKALGRRRESAATFDVKAIELQGTSVAKARLLGQFWAVLDLVPNAVIGLILVLGALAVQHHALTLGGLVAFITLALQLVWPVEALGYILASGEEAATASQRVLEILDTRPAITSEGSEGKAGKGNKAESQGALTFEHVGFGYPDSQEPVLRDVTLSVNPGETLVLTGATGCGKTTLLQLVPRLADATSGRIAIDGTDVRDMPLEELRTVVGCGFEEATLFSASVRENVTFGRPDATDEEIEAALTAAQARFAYDLPWGLDTRIGEQGMALSGGQRQRVALARAILSRPSVLVLDDPLSALDVQTEEKVTRALHGILTGVTALLVAHRPSTVALADRVALLDDGVIAAVGTHHDLLRNEPRYTALMTMDEEVSA